MARLGQGAWSFTIGYTLIPLTFYAVDAVLHLSTSKVVIPFLLNVALVATIFGVVASVKSSRDRLRVKAPVAFGIGAMLGLLHWFPLYMAFGARFVWQPVGSGGSLCALLLWNLIVPLVALSGATYDGSVLALIVAPFVLWWFVSRWSRTQARTN